MDKKTVRDIDVENKKVLVRVDFNVPMDADGNITDDTRIRASLETIKYLLKNKAVLILMAHLGRPKGKVTAQFSLAPVAVRLSALLKQNVQFVDNCIGQEVKDAVEQLEAGEVLLLENLRFHKEEEENDMDFAYELSELADVYVNDGFGVSHRAHASVEGITHFLPSVAGFLLEKELCYLSKVATNPIRPFVAIVGGAKVSDKIGVIDSLLDKADAILIGGGMANTFLAAEGFKLGNSLVEKDKLVLAKELLKKAEKNNVKMYLPLDLVMSESFSADAKYKVQDIGNLDQDYMALDIGPKTAELYANVLKSMKTIFWNGPMGVFEMDAFCKGTEAVAEALGISKGITIVGGGDSVAAIEKLKLTKKIKHISTGGGASLEYLEGKVLPGVAALDALRRPLIAGNWKMHKNVTEAEELAVDIVEETFGTTSEVVIFPPFTALETIAEAIDGKEVGYGAQNLHWEDKGAFTGEISGTMLADIGCQYVLVGHSERRTLFGEKDAIIAKKIRAAYFNELTPVLCVGENADEHQAGKTIIKIGRQISTALKGLSNDDVKTLVIAYEPLWAIGTGKTATVADAGIVAHAIRDRVSKMFGVNIAAKVRILYGGSVKAENAGDFHVSGIDGVLVGGASLDAASFAAIVRNF